MLWGCASFFFGQHKNALASFRKAAGGAHEPMCLPRQPAQWTRPSTNNWKPPFVKVGKDAVANSRTLGEDQISGLLIKHCNEVRTWTLGPDHWVAQRPRESFYETRAYYGALLEQTWIAPTIEERRQSGRADVFSEHYTTDGICHPDLDNAISTIAVWDMDGSGVCTRSVPGITLAAVFNHYKDERGFDQIYKAWREGRVLQRAMKTRGTASGKLRKVVGKGPKTRTFNKWSGTDPKLRQCHGDSADPSEWQWGNERGSQRRKGDSYSSQWRKSDSHSSSQRDKGQRRKGQWRGGNDERGSQRRKGNWSGKKRKIIGKGPNTPNLRTFKWSGTDPKLRQCQGDSAGSEWQRGNDERGSQSDSHSSQSRKSDSQGSEWRGGNARGSQWRRRGESHGSEYDGRWQRSQSDSRGSQWRRSRSRTPCWLQTQIRRLARLQSKIRTMSPVRLQSMPVPGARPPAEARWQ